MATVRGRPARHQLSVFRVRTSPTKPTTAATMPPMSIHIALSVGDPVKNLDTSEPKEFVALIPRITSTIPPTSSTIETSLFMISAL